MICITYLKYAYKSFKQFIEKLYTSTRAASKKKDTKDGKKELNLRLNAKRTVHTAAPQAESVEHIFYLYFICILVSARDKGRMTCDDSDIDTDLLLFDYNYTVKKLGR